MDEIFNFDPKNLEATSSIKLSEFTIGLSQFLIYFTSQINLTKVKLIQKERIIDIHINKSDIKTKTKIEKRLKVIENSDELKQVSVDVTALECELKMTENLEKYYVELINSFKRELTRREVEYKYLHNRRVN